MPTQLYYGFSMQFVIFYKNHRSARNVFSAKHLLITFKNPGIDFFAIIKLFQNVVVWDVLNKTKS